MCACACESNVEAVAGVMGRQTGGEGRPEGTRCAGRAGFAVHLEHLQDRPRRRNCEALSPFLLFPSLAVFGSQK